MSGMAKLEAFVAGVEQLQHMRREVAKAAEKPVTDVARASAAAGRAPNGTKWPERRGGGQALKGAADAITSETKGDAIILKVGVPYVYHHHGAGGTSTTKEAVRARERTAARQAETGTKSKFHAPQRQILPMKGEPLPSDMAKAIKAAAKEVFKKAVGG